MADTNDNILGGQDAVIRVGVQADMSDILQQATKFNELIKDANESFNVMQTVITSTTTRMSQLNSATQRLVSTTRQLRSEYQLIADSTRRIAPLSSMSDEGRAAISGIGGGNLASLAATGIPSPMMMPSGLVVPGGSLSGGGGAAAAVTGEPAASLGAMARGFGELTANASGRLNLFRKMLRYGYETHPNVIKSLGLNSEIFEEGSAAAQAAQQGRGGLQDVNGNILSSIANQSKGGGGAAFNELMNRLVNAGASPSSIGSAVLGRITGKIFGKSKFVQGLMGLLPEEAAAGGLGGLGASIGASAPTILGVLGAGVAAYKAADYMIKGATRYTGMTGGTGVYSSPAGFRGSFLGLQAHAWGKGLFNMAVGPGGYTEIQEGLLQAGYMPYTDQQQNKMGLQGMRFDRARSTLALLYGKGFQDVGTNITLMSTSLEGAQASTTAFMNSMDTLRVVATRTNASLQGMTKAMSTMMTSLVSGMGALGNWTLLSSTSQATAYANARNKILRDGGAVADLSSMSAQIQLINTPAYQTAGINLGNRYAAYNNGPNMSMILAQGQDQAVDQVLANVGLGNLRNMPYEQARQIILNTPYAIDMLKMSPLIQNMVGPDVLNNTAAFIEWVTQNATKNPQTSNTSELIKNAGATSISGYTNTAFFLRDQFDNKNSGAGGAVNHFLSKLRGNGGVIDNSLLAQYPIIGNYADYINDTHKKIGWLQGILQNGQTGQTYVKYNGESMTLTKFMQQYGQNEDARQLMASGQLQVAISESGKKPAMSDFSEAFNLGTNEKTMQNMTQSDLKDTFKMGLNAWVKDNNALGNSKLKVSVDGAFGIG